MKWRRAADSNWRAALDELHLKKDTAILSLVVAAGWRRTFPRAVAPVPSETPAAAIESAPPSAGLSADATGTGEAPEQPEDKTPLGALHKICARLDDELIALEALQAAQVLADGCVRLAISAPGRCRDRRVGAGHRRRLDGGRDRRSGRRRWRRRLALISGSRKWLAPPWSSMPCRSRRPSPRPINWSNKTRIGSRIEFESKLKALDEGRAKKVLDAEEELARRVAEFQSRQQKQTEEADKIYPAKLEDIRRIHDEAMKKVEDKYPPAHRRAQGKIRQGSPPDSTSRISKPRRRPRTSTNRPGTS